ncbi:MAG: DUF3422 domain-containing protein [Nitrococcus mobilis]|nr:DUF3422 domain-containing protein [Nitrococcus mobilis]
MNASKRPNNTNGAGLPEHPQRSALLAEVHARPVAPLRAPQHLSHLALYAGTGEHERELAHIGALCREFGIDPPAAKADHFLLETQAFRLRWEPHTEFSTYTLFSRAPDGQPFQTTGLDAVPAHWVAKLPGKLLAATHLSLVQADTVAEYPERMAEYFDLQSLTGSRCAGGAATVWTDFQPKPDGFTRFLVLDRGLRPAQAGRLIQRLLEIETYRLMALLALPIVRQLMPEITGMENALGELTERMASARDTEQEQGLLEALSSLSADVERIIAQNNFRLGAAAAYSALVRRRIDALRETRVEGVSTVHEFMGRRLVPAMDTCQAITERLDRLSRRVSRAASLLRSRVDLALEAQTRDLLESMNRRTRLQLRLQTTVESLSVVILSYYTIGLIHHALVGLEASGLHVPVELLTGLSVPVVIPAVAGGIFAIHRWVERTDRTTTK